LYLRPERKEHNAAQRRNDRDLNKMTRLEGSRTGPNRGRDCNKDADKDMESP